MEQKGFRPKLTYVNDLPAVERRNGIPPEFSSCHLAIVDGYVVEGHVSIQAISKLLTEKPDIDGIALPGMPQGAPGMEGVQTRPYTVYALKDGKATPFMTVNPKR